MPTSLESLCAQIDPAKTALIFGAGASVPSGAPNGAQLADTLWRAVAGTEAQDTDLIETASILERRFNRRQVMDEIRKVFGTLKPSGGLLAIPSFTWSAIFSTNFDQLIEKAYRESGLPLTAIRSNYDLTTREDRDGTTLYKIHGCITQDRSFGDKSSMILTQEDYDQFARYRQSLFSLLETMLLSGNVLIIGQSLRDRHLQDLVKRVLAAKLDGAPGQVYVLVYDKDDLRAPLLEDRGAKVIFAGIDEFVDTLANGPAKKMAVALPQAAGQLPPSLVASTSDISNRASSPSNVIRMFNGGAASYSDIRDGVTFERTAFSQVVEAITSLVPVTTIVGAAGVGKTTLARQAAVELSDRHGFHAWEHRSDFIFHLESWIALEARLRADGGRGILILDECTRFMRGANKLVEHLAGIEKPALQVILAANSAMWAPRAKSAVIFSKGCVIELSRLEDREIYSLLNLVEHVKKIADLVSSEFRGLGRIKQFERLRQKCSADMFVCLKNIFANELLDTILLNEFDDLDEAPQEYYRYVAALEAVGARVHRQLVLRMLHIPSDKVAAVLNALSGIIDEYDISPEKGLYGWSTRHLVIARKITEYKFSGADELIGLFEKIIDNLNPAVHIELQSMRDICDTEFGIGRIGDHATRRRLFRKLIDVAPGERIPWHRLIRELLDNGSVDETEYAIRNAEDAVGADGPLDRYKIRLLLLRVERTERISDSDRLALLRRAYELALTHIERHRDDKLTYRQVCEVAVALVRRGEKVHILAEAIAKLRVGADRILDPDMHRWIRYYEQIKMRGY